MVYTCRGIYYIGILAQASWSLSFATTTTNLTPGPRSLHTAILFHLGLVLLRYSMSAWDQAVKDFRALSGNVAPNPVSGLNTPGAGAVATPVAVPGTPVPGTPTGVQDSPQPQELGAPCIPEPASCKIQLTCTKCALPTTIAESTNEGSSLSCRICKKCDAVQRSWNRQTRSNPQARKDFKKKTKEEQQLWFQTERSKIKDGKKRDFSEISMHVTEEKVVKKSDMERDLYIPFSIWFRNEKIVKPELVLKDAQTQWRQIIATPGQPKRFSRGEWLIPEFQGIVADAGLEHSVGVATQKIATPIESVEDYQALEEKATADLQAFSKSLRPDQRTHCVHRDTPEVHPCEARGMVLQTPQVEQLMNEDFNGSVLREVHENALNKAEEEDALRIEITEVKTKTEKPKKPAKEKSIAVARIELSSAIARCTLQVEGKIKGLAETTAGDVKQINDTIIPELQSEADKSEVETLMDALRNENDDFKKESDALVQTWKDYMPDQIASVQNIKNLATTLQDEYKNWTKEAPKKFKDARAALTKFRTTFTKALSKKRSVENHPASTVKPACGNDTIKLAVARLLGEYACGAGSGVDSINCTDRLGSWDPTGTKVAVIYNEGITEVVDKLVALKYFKDPYNL